MQKGSTIGIPMKQLNREDCKKRLLGRFLPFSKHRGTN
jgi:hypothetical protein